jgi:hypothetical protein
MVPAKILVSRINTRAKPQAQAAGAPELRNEAAHERDRSSPPMKMRGVAFIPADSEELTQVIENRSCASYFRKNPISRRPPARGRRIGHR